MPPVSLMPAAPVPAIPLSTVRNLSINGTNFCAKDFVSGKVNLTDNTYSVHHFRGSWLESKNKRENRFVEIIYAILGEKAFRKLMKWYLLRLVKTNRKKIYKKR